MSKKMPPAMKFLLLPFYGSYLKLRYGIRTEGFEKALPFDGPAIVFSNHVHLQDPFLISARYPYHIRWVTGSHMFRVPVLGTLLLKWVYCIPKTQGRSDLETIRNVSKALKNGDIVGLFPEGTRTWDGDITDIVGGTSKLIRLFKVPVIFVNIEGGFARKPRWCEKDAGGKIDLHITKVLTPEEIASMKLPEIQQVVHDHLAFSHEKWIEEHPDHQLKSRKLAEGIERLFYRCPCCHGIGTIHSHGNDIECTCGAKAHINGKYGIDSDSIPFKTLPEWHRWEYDELKKLLEKPAEERLFPEDRGILFEKTVDEKEVVISRNFTFTSYSDRFSFDFGSDKLDGESKVDFLFKDVESVIITAKQTIEFYYNGQQYRFRPYGRISTLKYQEIYNAYRERLEAE